MIHLDGGIVLPTPKKAKGFSRPENITDYRWKIQKGDRWLRAYTHCLYSLPLHFDLPLHTVVPRIARKMLESDDPFNVVLRFLGEMEADGYIKFERGYDERVVLPTRKFTKLALELDCAPQTVISYPRSKGDAMPSVPVRGGISGERNKIVSAIAQDMAKETFEINQFVVDLVKQFPPEFDKCSDAFMYERSMNSAEHLAGQRFMFPYFLCSRSRMYVDTTCGVTPQGADHEKAMIIPTFAIPLTGGGFDALVDMAKGYSEQPWGIQKMIEHARDPVGTVGEWMCADKPYCYMSTAKMISMYVDDPQCSLPAFPPLDGRCSGLQHLTALSRSDALTRHIGMHEEEADLDIYEKVAEDWKYSMEDVGDRVYATRKAAKIPVMTWGYSATVMTSTAWMHRLYGAKSVWDVEDRAYKIVGDGLPMKRTARMGADLYMQLNLTLGPLKEVVDWLTASARAIASKGNVEITWYTPDGFLCSQRKVKGERKQVTCMLDNGDEVFVEVKDFSGEKVNTQKHAFAISPNIVHGLDATHLRMVARRLKELGYPMIFIHDSFATHANYRDELYRIIVDTFIELYSGTYLSDLRSYWSHKYDVDLQDPPSFGSWNPESMRGLRLFFK